MRLHGRGYQGGGVSFGPPVTPPVIKNLIIANVVAMIAVNWIPGLANFLVARPIDFWQGGMLWQPFTYMFLHAGLIHIVFNMFALWMFGSPVASAWGAKRFLRYYLLCGLGAGLLIVTIPYLFNAPKIIPTVGASGAVFGVLLAYSLIWPDRTIMLLFPPIPIRAIYLIPLLFLFEFMAGPSNISHTGHLGGVLVGWLLLRKDGRTGALAPSWKGMRHRWRRHQMRKRLRAVRDEERREREKSRQDRTFH